MERAEGRQERERQGERTREKRDRDTQATRGWHESLVCFNLCCLQHCLNLNANRKHRTTATLLEHRSALASSCISSFHFSLIPHLFLFSLCLISLLCLFRISSGCISSLRPTRPLPLPCTAAAAENCLRMLVLAGFPRSAGAEDASACGGGPLRSR